MDVLSNMGINGKPGASLRGWKDFFPSSEIFGADIDKRILFKEDRITTFYCDQTNPQEIDNLYKNPELSDNFDVIIEDGWHVFEAQVCFFENSIHKLNNNGYYIIEDVHNQLLDEKYNDQINKWRKMFPDLLFWVCRLPTKLNALANNLIIIHKN